MTASMSELITLIHGTYWASLLVFLRIGAMMALLPAFGEQTVPVRVRLGLTLGFTLIVTPAVTPLIDAAPSEAAVFLGRCGAEMLSGLFLGMMLRLFIHALQIAGTIAAQTTSLSQIFGASAGIDPMPAIGNTLTIAGLALACLMGLHVHLAAFMIDSYTLLPPGQAPTPAAVAEAGTDQVAHIFGLAFVLAAPFVVASLIYNIVLGVINKAMPQLMVALVGAPAITAGGLALLALAAPLLLSVWYEALARFLDTPFGGR